MIKYTIRATSTHGQCIILEVDAKSDFEAKENVFVEACERLEECEENVTLRIIEREPLF